jgi:small subunit ribosomal protein S3
VKVWIYKGEAPTSRAGREAQQAALRAAAQQRPSRPSRDRDRDREPQRRRRAPEGATAGEEG